MRLLSLDLYGREIRNGLAQQYFNGAQLGHGEANLTKGTLLKPIDQLTGADFFPDVVGVKEHFALGHLFCLLRAYSTGCQADLSLHFCSDFVGMEGHKCRRVKYFGSRAFGWTETSAGATDGSA